MLFGVQLATCRFSLTATTAIALLSAFAGCGRPSYMRETAPVKGTVTLDNKPLPSGYVIVPTTSGRMAKGRIRSDGTFELSTYSDGDGAQVGKHPVVVIPVPPDEEADKRIAIPSRYESGGTSGLSVDVVAGQENEITLELFTKKP